MNYIFKSLPGYLQLACLLTLLIPGCGAAQESEHPNIVWIVCEDIGPYIGAYGYKGVKTPNLDKLALEGERYTSAYTTAGVCAPSRSAIITGMYQTSLGTMHMRTLNGDNPANSPLPSYSAVIPSYVKCFPETFASRAITLRITKNRTINSNHLLPFGMRTVPLLPGGTVSQTSRSFPYSIWRLRMR
jgi:hypothetical protein